MPIKVLLAHILGYVNIVIEGYFIERFINICISKKIFLWNMKREKSSILFANVRISDFKRIKKIAKDTKCKVKITAKKGVPFFLHRYKKRKLFAIFLILIVLSILTLSQFIWNIDIVGTQQISKEELASQLEEIGLTVGKSKNKIPTKEIINKIRMQREDLAWIGIEVKGTNAIVKVVEAEQKPEIIDEKEYCNIVANKEGIITSIKAVNGTPLVKEGDVVKKRNHSDWRMVRRKIYRYAICT